MPKTADYEKQLKTRRDYLTRALKKFEKTLVETPNADSEDRATEREGDEVLEGLGASGLEELRRIEAALERIEAGTFGICPKCGEEISKERLDAVPYAALCRNCM